MICVLEHACVPRYIVTTCNCWKDGEPRVSFHWKKTGYEGVMAKAEKMCCGAARAQESADFSCVKIVANTGQNKSQNCLPRLILSSGYFLIVADAQ